MTLLADPEEFIHDHGSHAKLTGELEQSRKTPPAQVGLDVSCVIEFGSAPTHVLLRGNPKAKGDPVEPGFPEVLLPGKASAVTGGRTALAKWLTDPANPLTLQQIVDLCLYPAVAHGHALTCCLNLDRRYRSADRRTEARGYAPGLLHALLHQRQLAVFRHARDTLGRRAAVSAKPDPDASVRVSGAIRSWRSAAS